MTQQEQFEKDYLAAFPHRDGLMGCYHNGRYVCADIQDAYAVWLQQAERNEAELRAKASAAGAVPVDIEEYLSTYEWRTEDGGLAELTARDRHLLQDFANGLPLYTAPPAQAVSLTTPTLNASCVPEGQSCAITPCQYQDGSCAYCDDEGGTLFQSTKQACEWLAGRFEFSGIGDGVARSYAKHLRTMLAAAPEQKK